MSRRAAIIVLDGVGIGAATDAHHYGDAGSDTLGNMSRAIPGFALPALEALGLGTLAPITGLSPSVAGQAARCTMQPASPGKDSTTGHWELCGLHLVRPFPTYPGGFPPEVVAEFARLTGRGVVANVAGGGTAVIDTYGQEHLATGAWILYTSADSVFQVAAHEDVVPLTELYAACRVARELLRPPHDVSRVIARPFLGCPGTWRRTANRRDFSLEPPGETLLDALAAAGIERKGVGKIDDLFGGRSITSVHTADNAEGLREIRTWIDGPESGLLFANLVDFDQQFGHRNDALGFYGALRQFDGALPGLIALLHEDDLLILTADHGNDPTTPSTDHARERAPMLMTGRRVRPVHLGERSTYSDLGATVGEWFGLSFRGAGTSFLAQVLA